MKSIGYWIEMLKGVNASQSSLVTQKTVSTVVGMKKHYEDLSMFLFIKQCFVCQF